MMGLVLLVFIYAILYPPFIATVFTDDFTRITVEFITLFSLVILYIKSRFIYIPKLLFFYGALTAFTYFLVINDLGNLLSSFNKILFFILLAKILQKNASITKYFRIVWVSMWVFLSVTAVFTFISYQFNLLKFQELNAVISNYYYFSHPILGNVIEKDFETFRLGKVVGYMFEYGQLGFFFGFNIISAKFLVSDPQRRKLFIVLNLLGGIVTFSLTFYCLFLINALLAAYLQRRKGQGLLLPLLCSVVVLLIVYALLLQLGMMDFFSLSQRQIRFDKGLAMLSGNSTKAWMFGNGITFTLEEAGMGLSAGLFNILVSRGITCLMFILYLTYKYAGYNMALMLYILLYNMAFESFWYPIFWLGLAIAFAVHYHKSVTAKKISDPLLVLVSNPKLA